MKVYEFPGKKPPEVEIKTPEQHKLHLGPIGFTCPNCQSTSELHFDNMIFRSIEFHCGSCGTFYKMSNPGFTNSPPKKPPRG